jgi:hypothetical protein
LAKITIDNKEYDTDDLSDEVKNALAALQFTEVQIQQLQAKLAAMQTARMAYATGLKQALEKTDNKPSPAPAKIANDTIQFS